MHSLHNMLMWFYIQNIHRYSVSAGVKKEDVYIYTLAQNFLILLTAITSINIWTFWTIITDVKTSI